MRIPWFFFAFVHSQLFGQIRRALSRLELRLYRVVVLSFLVIGFRASFAATYYVCGSTSSCNANGGSGWSGTPRDSNGGTSKSAPLLTITGGIGKMAAGDTLIVGNGTYTQQIRYLPSGSASAYTTVQAENDWGVLIDGTGWANSFINGIDISESYILVRGFRIVMSQAATNNTPIMLYTANHVKLIRIGAWGGATSVNEATFTVAGGSYNLIEECYAFGGSRYQFLIGGADHTVVRRSVARNDYSTAPIQCAGFTNYNSIETVWENDIALDSDTAYCSAGYYGGFFSENKSDDTHGGDTTEYLYGNIVLNIRNSLYSDGITDSRMSGTRVISNLILWNSLDGYAGDQVNYTGAVPANLTMTNVTIGDVVGTYNVDNGYEAGGTAVSLGSTGVITNSVTNSLFWNNNYYGIAGYVTSDFNAFYGNAQGNAGGSPTPALGAHSVTNINPTTSVKYLPRIEAGSPLATAGSGGGPIGAQILYETGVSGTLYGDPGYDQLTSTVLWPFPNEAQIKADMAAYSGPGAPGLRGFAASGNGLYGGPITLTSYIWEQLGYACPGDCKTASAFLPSGSVGTSYTLTVNAPTGGTITGTNCTSGGYASGTSVSCTATPNSGSTFAGWLGGTCSGTTNPCTFTLSGNDTVTATFNSSGTNYNLTVSKNGTGGGTISGTNCTSASDASGTSVTCHGVASAGSTFAGWSGTGSASGCTGTSDCSFSVTATSTITGTFNTSGGALTLGRGTCSATMAGTQYVAFSGCTLAASGGTPPYTYSWKAVTDGSYAALPEGLSVNNSTGAISGTVYGQGSYVPQFVVSDSAGASATLSTITFSLTGDNTLDGCSLFPSDSIFHQRVDTLPLDTSPAAPIYSSYQSATLHAFFGNGGNGNLPNGIPVFRVPYNQANATVTNTTGGYFTSGPIPSYAPVEGTSTSVNGDRHVLVLQTAGAGNPCKLWEMYQGTNTGPTSWQDVGNADWSNLGTTGTGAYAMPPQDTGTTDAAGLPIAPLLVNADEVIGTGTPSAPTGSVQHPIRFTVQHMLNSYVWPGTAHAGTGSCSGGYSDANSMLLQGAGAPTSCTMTGPAGEMYRLKASVATPACAASSPQAAIIIQGLRQYGIILADNGSSGGLIGTPDARWNDNDLACLTQLTLANFEPVDVSSTAKTVMANYNGSGFSAPVTSYQTTTSGGSTLTGISVTPTTASIAAGSGTQQYAAQCTYSDNTTSDCTATVSWSTSNMAVATISTGGLASGVVAGTATIIAASTGITGSAVLTVTGSGGTLTGISVSPATASIAAGTGTQQYAAQCAYSNNTNFNCTATVTWSSSNGAVVAINSAGLATGKVAGTSTIKATSGTVSGTAVLTVTSTTLTGITVTPATASIAAGSGTQQYAAQCAYSNSTNSNCTSTVNWSSSNAGVATVSSAGLAAGVAAGSATIKAGSGTVSGTAVVTVTEVPVNLTRGLWAWMTGRNTVPAANKGRPGIYNALGTPAAGNTPGGRTASVGWTDSSGNLWLFGGRGFDSAGVDGYLNDLWEYLPATDEWAWMGGSSTVPAANQGWPGVYGTVGTPVAGNSPGSRESSVSWTDKAGNFWLFGGIGYDSAGTNGSLNDLWEFTVSTQQWAWMGGGSTVPAANQGSPGVYGQLGVADASNIPGGRWGANSWTDASGNLWLFGGVGYDSSGSLGSLNDLWQLDPSKGKWTWIGGSNTVGSGGGQTGVYGSLGNPTATNVPSGRSQAVSWADSHGNFWLFGGRGYDSTGTLGYLNDLWEFDPTTRRWAWVGGSNSVGCADCGRPGSYGTLSNADSANIPGGRTQAVGWTDGNGNLWLLGGNGYDSADTLGLLNDLWEFLPSTLEWAWMGGSSTVPGANQGSPGIYGQSGIPDAGNTPGGRWATSGWTDSDGNLWLLGGSGDDAAGANGLLNDLWVYQPSPGSLPAAEPTLSVGPGTYNAVQIVTVADVTPAATIFYTTDGTTPGTNSSVYTGPITVSSSMTIKAIAAAKNYKTSDIGSATYTITPAFTIAPQAGSPTTESVQPGGSATYSLVVTPVGSSTLIAPLTLTATGLPPGSTAIFSPKSLAAGVGTSDVSLSIQTSTTSASMVPTGSKWTLALCMLFFPLLLRRWRCFGKQLSLRARLIPGLLVLAGMALALTGCAGVVLNNNGSGSTPTAYTITVTAATGQVQKTTTVTLSVQ